MILAHRGKITTCLYYLGLLISVLAVVSSYLLESVFNGSTLLAKSSLGVATVVQFCVLFGGMLVVWAFSPGCSIRSDASISAKAQTISHYTSLLLVAVAVRVILVPIDSYTSNDVARYLFDGYIALSGLDPYRISHDAIELVAARELWSPPIEHVQYVTLYPPLALALFSAAASAGPEYAPLIWKLMTTVASLITLLLTVLILKRAGKLQHLSLVALSPILIFESGIGVHLDIYSALAVCCVIYAMQRKLYLWVGIFIGLGTLIKLLPLVLAGPIFLSLRNIKQSLRFALAAVLTILSGYAIAYALGLHPIGSIGMFFAKFRFGSPYFSFMEAYFSLDFIRYVSGVLLFAGLCLLAWVTWKNSRKWLDNANVSAMQVALCLPLLLSPVIYPWYLAPLVPLLALSPRPFILLWLALLPLSYEVLGRFICCVEWQPADWPVITLGLGMIACLVVWLLMRRKNACRIEQYSQINGAAKCSP